MHPDHQSYPSSEEDIRESGAGILEFSTAKAGQDITPANYDFEMKEEKKKTSAGFSNLAGNWNLFLAHGRVKYEKTAAGEHRMMFLEMFMFTFIYFDWLLVILLTFCT